MKLFCAIPNDKVNGRLDPDAPGTQMEIDFEQVWTAIIKPAIPSDWQAERGKDLRDSGLIDKLYMERLREADLVLADLTFSNPNVFYELGIRQALREKGTVLIVQRNSVLPFDIRNQSVVYYDYSHAPSLAKFQLDLRDTLMAAAAKPGGSPVHDLLPDLFRIHRSSGKHPDEETATAAQSKGLTGPATGKTIMLIPFVAASGADDPPAGTFDTGIAIANTTKYIHFGTNAQGAANGSSGPVSFHFYPSDNSPSFSIIPITGCGLVNGTIPAGGSFIANFSDILKAGNQIGNFTGYVFIQANFSHAHGSAFLYGGSAPDKVMSAQPVLVISDPTVFSRDTNFGVLPFSELTSQ